MNHNMYGWYFTKNTYTGKWMAAKSEHLKDLYNDFDSPNVLKSSSIKTLEEIINRTNGDKVKIKKLIR